MLSYLALALPALIDPPQIYHGRAGNLDVRLPRLEAEIEVDGQLTEEAWGQAAVLTGFSQFSPSDGVPAADSTDVLVWYSPTAIHFGIRAWEAHGAVHATLADRDRIGADDHVQILLSTFNDGRQATVFAVNPYGVQSDGALVETGSTSRKRVHQRGGPPGDGRPEPGLHLPVQGPGHRARLRGRDPDSLQEPALPVGAGADLGHPRHSAGAALGVRGLLGARPPLVGLVPGPVRAAGRADRSPSRPGAGHESVSHLEDHRPTGRVGVGVRLAAVRRWAAPPAGESPTT